MNGWHHRGRCEEDADNMAAFAVLLVAEVLGGFVVELGVGVTVGFVVVVLVVGVGVGVEPVGVGVGIEVVVGGGDDSFTEG